MPRKRNVKYVHLILLPVIFMLKLITFKNFRSFDVMTCNSYLLVKLETENSSEVDTSISYLTSNIGLSLQNLFGEVGQ